MSSDLSGMLIDTLIKIEQDRKRQADEQSRSLRIELPEPKNYNYTEKKGKIEAEPRRVIIIEI